MFVYVGIGPDDDAAVLVCAIPSDELFSVSLLLLLVLLALAAATAAAALRSIASVDILYVAAFVEVSMTLGFSFPPFSSPTTAPSVVLLLLSSPIPVPSPLLLPAPAALAALAALALAASASASRRAWSARICLTVLLRRCGGFQDGLRNGRGVEFRSSCWRRAVWAWAASEGVAGWEWGVVDAVGIVAGSEVERWPWVWG